MITSLAGFSAGMALTQVSDGYAVIALGEGIVGLFAGLMVPFESLTATNALAQLSAPPQ